jgi:hypothetical protein
MKVIHEHGASATIKVVVKQLCYIPVMARMKWLFMCEETAQQMSHLVLRPKLDARHMYAQEQFGI